MKILFATTEFADFTKAGGLGEVSASLPRSVRSTGADIRVLLPGYPAVLAAAPSLRIVGKLPGRSGIAPCTIGHFTTQDGLEIYALLAPDLYQRGGNAYGRV